MNSSWGGEPCFDWKRVYREDGVAQRTAGADSLDRQRGGRCSTVTPFGRAALDQEAVLGGCMSCVYQGRKSNIANGS